MPDVKRLFSSPKKAAATLLCAGVIVVMLGVCIVVYASSGPSQTSAIGGERAQSFAFADAGVDPVDAREVSVDYERFQDGFVYEVEFTAGDTEYEYKIGAEDGSVVKKESKTVRALEDGSPAVTLEEAQAIALADAGLTLEQAEITGTELGSEQGMPVYQIKFRGENAEYTYEINAQTGSVYSKSTVVYAANDPGGTPAPAQSSSPTAQETLPPVQTPAPGAQPTQALPDQPYIDLDAAKSAALADAGVDASQARFTKAQMDWEDRITVYELEFCTTTHAYEYEINAATGAVYDRSVEVLASYGGHHPDSHHGEWHHGSNCNCIGTDAARLAALSHAGCSAGQVVFSKEELDYDGGRAVYEIEFYKDGIEYEYEIDAATGAVLEYNWDQH